MTMTFSGVTFTDTKDETIKSFERIEAMYGAGSTVGPSCAHETRRRDAETGRETIKVCGATTSYIIEPCELVPGGEAMPGKVLWRMKNKAAGIVLNLTAHAGRFLPDDEDLSLSAIAAGPKSTPGAVYIPMRVCLRCGAGSDGYRDGVSGLPKRRAPKSLTVVEVEVWKKVYDAAYFRGYEKFREAIAQGNAKKDKKRYAEKA